MYDVAIVGGGPAGSTAATLLARAGRQVVVFEREKFPRFHIGESLLPFSIQTFDRLGVREKLDCTFLPKFGGEIMAACGTRGVKFYFKDGFRSQRDRAYQVTRSDFDKLLLDHSRENGAEVFEETEVKAVDFATDAVKLDVENSRGMRSTINARYLLDCSGRQTTLGSLFKLKKTYDHLQKFSVFAHYENIDRLPGRDATLIRMVRGLDRWFWMIPLTDVRTSVGVVMDTATAEKAADTLDEVLRDESKRQRLFAKYSRTVNRIMDIYLTFVTAWYQRGKEFLEVFLNPTDTMQIAAAVNAILAGNEGKSLAIKWRMWLFYFFVYAQKFFAFSPRLSLAPKEEGSASMEAVRAAP